MADKHLPWALIEKIQLLLPVKSLARFKCVCRSWNSRISGAEFLEIYRNSKTRRVYPMFMKFSIPRPEYLYFGWRGQDDRIQLKFPVEKLRVYLRPVGTSDGIVCFFRPQVLVLWAPSLEESLEVYTLSAGFKEPGSFAIGHHPDTHDLNLVQLTSYGPHKLNCLLYSHQARKWRVVSQDLDLGLRWVVEFGWQAQSHSGRFHWIVRGEEFRAVVWFDMRSDELGVMDLPESLRVVVQGEDARRVEFSKLGSYDGKLTVLAYEARGWGDSCEVWVMEEYGSPNSWRELGLEIELEEFRVVGFLENFTLLLYLKKRRKVWYDVRTNRVTDSVEADCFVGAYEETFYHLSRDRLYL